MEAADRLRAGMKASGYTQSMLAEKVGISRQYLSRILIGDRSGDRYWIDFAQALGVTVEWLTTGTGIAPTWWKPAAQTPPESPESPGGIQGNFAFSGRVTAGGGFVHAESGASIIHLKNGLQAVLVEGDSAYPVVFPGQYVIVDGTRSPSDGNLVVCQTEDGQALLKRYLLDKKNGTVVS